MKTSSLILIILILFIPSFAVAHDIILPPDLNAKASIARSDRDDLWEKTLVVQFPQRRRVLSTNDGAVDVMVGRESCRPPGIMESRG